MLDAFHGGASESKQMSSVAARTPLDDIRAGLARVDEWVLKVAQVANNSVGNALGSAWLSVIGIVASAGIIAAVSFVISTSVTVGHLSDQQAIMGSDIKDIRSDLKELRGQLGARSNRDP